MKSIKIKDIKEWLNQFDDEMEINIKEKDEHFKKYNGIHVFFPKEPGIGGILLEKYKVGSFFDKETGNEVHYIAVR